MSVDIRTSSIKPVRNTFQHLAKRFGTAKTATRYQEIAYDVQSEVNFHYKPLWDPDRDVYDRARTAVVMADWYTLKDPRQYYYGNYTMTRAKQQEALDRQLEFVEKRDLLRILPESVRQAIIFALVPLRHYEWGANLNNAHIAAYGWSTIVTQAAMMHAADRLGMAQHLSRIGLMIDGNSGDSLTDAKAHWTEHAAWQGLRRQTERMFVTRDWFELMVAQNFVADGLVYPLCIRGFETQISDHHGATLASLTDYLMRWQAETSRWVDACIKTAAAESEANQALISGWTRQWRDDLVSALAPWATAALGGQADTAVQAAVDEFTQRATKLGLSIEKVSA